MSSDTNPIAYVKNQGEFLTAAANGYVTDIIIDPDDSEYLVIDSQWTGWGNHISKKIIHGNNKIIQYGTSNDDPRNKPLFYQGDSVTIKDLTLEASMHLISDASNYWYGAFFRKTTNCLFDNCHVKGEVRLEHKNITTTIYIGGFVGASTSTRFYSCSNSAVVEYIKNSQYLTAHMGGFCGKADQCRFDYCRNEASLYTTLQNIENDFAFCYAGGIAGATSSTLYIACVNNGPITALRCNLRVGGICGYVEHINYNSFKYCVNRAEISETMNAYPPNSIAGGVIGYIQYNNNAQTVNIEFCRNEGSVSCSCAGGIVGSCNTQDYYYKLPDPGKVILLNNTNSADIHGIKYAGGIIGRTDCINMDIKNNCVSSQTEIIQGLYAGGIAGEISSYNENSPTVVLMTNHLANNIVNAGKIIGSNEDPPAIGYARRIVGRSIIELGLNYLFSPPLGYIAYNTYMFDSNYANPNTLIVGNNQLDDINPGMNYGQPGEPVDADADPDYGANRMQGANFVESVLPDGWKYDECLKPAFDPDETVPDQARCTDMPSARSADDRPAPIAKAAPPQATASLATSSAKAFTSVVNSIASMEYGLQKMLKAGASIVNLGVENNASPSDMAEYSGLAAHIVEGARDTEGKLLDKLCCSMAYLQSYMDHECSNESGGGDCPKRWQIRMNTVLCDLDFSVQAQFIITNTVTNEITRVVTDANGHLVLDLYAGEYTMTLYDTGENNLAPDTRRIIVGGDGTYFVGGEMIRHPETGICDLCLALAPLSDYSPPETGE